MTQGIYLADELNFSTPEELETWLKDKPVEWAQVIAVRSALRVLPNLQFPSKSGGVTHIEDVNEIYLAGFRANFISLASVIYKSERLNINGAAYNATSCAAATLISSIRATIFAAARAAGAVIKDSNLDFTSTSLVIDAAIRAIRASSKSESYSLIMHAIEKDIEFLVTESSNNYNISNNLKLANMRLWTNGNPRWVVSNWLVSSNQILQGSMHHQVWIDWYNNLLNGKSFFGLLPKREKALTLKIARQPNEFWDQGFSKVSEDISGWLDEARIEDAEVAAQRQLDEEGADQVAPTIPVPMPATLEPEWQNGRLVLPSSPLDDDLKGASIESALEALKSDFSEFVAEIGSEANIDQRASSYLAKIAEDIPASPPPQNELFSLAHKEAFFTGYAKTVSDEWPEFLAARFHALGLQFSRAMKQFPEWREFKANADQKQLSSDDIENIEQLANAMEQSLREELALDFVDQGIADVIADMASQLSLETESISPEQADAFIQSGKDLLAIDTLESIKNLIKRVVEGLLVAKGHAFNFVRYSGKLVGDGLKDGYEALLKGGSKALIKWGVPFFVGSRAIGLIQENFPSFYAWLETIIKLII